jgi:alkanesulfonate monooxygenase SsuD/methylene tetrahydromethanopterin reductase-like flavin-dependent oxidoreductase (luciferase family)
MTAYSVLVPFLPRRPEQLLPYAALVEWTAARRLWQGQAMLIEPFQGFASAAGAGFRVPTGVGVTLMGLRHPFEAAHQVRSLALATGESVVAGFGPGGRQFQAGVLSRPYASPLTASREYLTIVRGLLERGAVDVDGEYFSCHGAMPPAIHPRIDLGLGVLRPGMARLAGEVADVGITWLTPAGYLRDVILPALREGAERAGRETPRLTAMVPLALAEPGREPEKLVLASNAKHMQAPHYMDMLKKAGIELAGDASIADAKSMLHGRAFLYGTLDEIREELAAYREIGVDEIILNLTGVYNLHGPQAAMTDLKKLLAAAA